VRVLLVVVAVLCGLLAAGPSGAVDAAKAPKPPKPTVTVVKPSSGPVAGGTKVVVKGKNLTGAKKVLFGKVKGTKVTVKSAKKLTVVAPAQAAGKVHVRVVTKGGKSGATAADFFAYLAPPPPPVSPPTVTGVTPGTGPTAGGTLVTLSGTHLTGATAVTFGGAAGTGITAVSATSLKVTTPVHATGIVDVRVTTPAGTSAVTAAGKFQFEAPAPVPRAYAAPMPGDADQDPGAVLNAVSCPAPQTCFAVGGYLSGGQRVPLVEQQTGPDTWEFFRPDLPGDASPGADVDLVDVDCATPTFCVAVGTYIDDSPAPLYLPLVETWDGVAWTPSSPALPGNSGFTEDVLLSDVDCPAVGTCVAVGRYDDDVDATDLPLVLALSGATWTHPTLALPVGSIGKLNSVDCPSSVACVAVGEETSSAGAREPLAVTGPGPWTVDTSVGLPSDVDAGNPRALLQDVSCSAVGACVAAGSYVTGTSKAQGLVEVLATTTWTAVSAAVPFAAAPNTPAANPQVQLTSVSCASACLAVGDYRAAGTGNTLRPLLVRIVGTTATVERAAVPNDAEEAPSGSHASATCTSGQRCVAVGFYDVNAGLRAPLLSTLDAGQWSPSPGPRPADVSDSVRPLASTLDGSAVVSVGYYVDLDGFTRALLMLDLPI
jgi:IPT/TIG domain